MKIAVTGASGLIGTALVPALEARGHRIVRVVRASEGGPDRVRWDPERGALDAEALAGVDAAVNLAGEPIGKRRWSARQKARILNSRVRGTETLARDLAALSPRPRVLINASAMGFYGDCGDEVLTEASPSGSGFLASVCRRWEAATAPASNAEIRVVLLRTGLVLHPSGGLLKRVLLPFRMGLGGRLSTGRQWMSWVTLADHIGAMLHLLEDDDARGAFNVATSNPVRNVDFTRALARVLRRPGIVPIPKALIAVPFGRELTGDLLASIRMAPERLDRAGYRFESPELEPALRALLER
ncbi:MAG: TIGR01777 family protein [Actinobacteria bacterium]|nr:MAG: TIGR01777 family protein [Actinomycetota bacterium]